MASFNDIATSLRVDTQLPLDHKQFAVSQLVLADLGDDNNLAFTYYDNLKVFCWNEKTEWVWREVQDGEEDTGLVPSDFVYPNGVVYPNPGYEGKAYNFFPLVAGTQTKIEAGTDILITGDGSLNNPYIINSDFVYNPLPEDMPPFKRMDEGSGNGIFLRARNSINFGPIGFNAFDVSHYSLSSNTIGATGSYSFAQGESVRSTATHSITMGKTIDNSGDYTFATGKDQIVTAHFSTIGGIGNNIAGKAMTCFGIANQITGAGMTVLGIAANIYTTLYDYNGSPTKPILLVGNGTVDNTTNLANTRSDAFIVRYNGDVEAPDMSIAAITNSTESRILTTREYVSSLIPVKPYKSYVALLSQSGTANPTLVTSSPLENELNATIVWTRLGFPGQYKGVLNGAFTLNKTVVFVQDNAANKTKIVAIASNLNTINIYTYNDGIPADDLLIKTAIEIRVYN